MARLGISIYPEHSTREKDFAYIDLASKYGFSRIFTCLLSVLGKTPEEIKAEFKELIDYAHAKGFEVILDVAPYVFEHLGISYDNLKFFADIGADGIRLDESYNSLKEALMTYNKYNLKIEINSSNECGYLDNIMTHQPKRDKLVTCFNFYPQKYSGMGYDAFIRCAENVRKHGLVSAGFVSSNAENSFGPWAVNEGLCTMEMHRDLPIDVQTRHYYATGLVDDVIVANAYATEEELKSMTQIRPFELGFKIDFEYEISEDERKIIYDAEHFVRGDMSEYMARSTMTRIIYKDANIPPKNTRPLKRGDIIVVNNDYDRYKGELHIVMKDMENDGRKNVVGHVPENELMLVDYLKPWKSFCFVK